MKILNLLKPAPRSCAAIALCLIAANSPGADWPQWRGPTRNGYAAEGSPVISSLPKDVTPVWKVSIGGGFSSPVISANKLVYLDEKEGKEFAHLLAAESGKELWSVEYSPSFGDEWGTGPRATPIIDGSRVYVQSCVGEFRCLDVSSGKVVWATSFEKDFGVKFLGSKANEGTASRRGNNGTGVIDGDRIVLPVGNVNGASLVCFDKNSGKVMWKSGNDEAGYASFVIATIGGVKQVVAFTADSLLGADIESGEILWRVPLVTNAKRHACTPLVMGDRVVVNSHTIGMRCFQIAKDTGGFKAEPAWSNKDLKINLASPVLIDGHIYSQGPNRDYVCVDASNGQTKWSQSGFGQGKKDYASTIVVGKNLLVLTEDGTLILLQPNPAKYTELGRLQVCGNTWSFPAFADGKLYVRDGRQLLCVDLVAGNKT